MARIVSNKHHIKQLKKELRQRYDTLIFLLEESELSSNKEGCKKRSHWANPELQCALNANETGIRMGVDDFKVVLSEIRKLK